MGGGKGYLVGAITLIVLMDNPESTSTDGAVHVNKDTGVCMTSHRRAGQCR